MWCWNLIFWISHDWYTFCSMLVQSVKTTILYLAGTVSQFWNLDATVGAFSFCVYTNCMYPDQTSRLGVFLICGWCLRSNLHFNLLYFGDFPVSHVWLYVAPPATQPEWWSHCGSMRKLRMRFLRYPLCIAYTSMTKGSHVDTKTHPGFA